MKHSKFTILTVFLLALTFTFSGCFHATVETGKTPSNTVIEQPWALSFIYGLIPPATVDASEKCTSGVAKVETQISFLNGLVAAVTFSLVTPMNIKVTCAQSGMGSLENSDSSSIAVQESYSEEQTQQAFKEAADLAVQNNEAVYVKFE